MSNSTRKKLTISMEVQAFSNTGYAILLDSLEKALSKSDYEDGRMSFDREMIQAGLVSLVTRAVEQRVREFMVSKYGKGTGYATALDETNKFMKTDFIGAFVGVDEWTVSVENISES